MRKITEFFCLFEVICKGEIYVGVFSGGVLDKVLSDFNFD